jgi:hypothetical protein
MKRRFVILLLAVLGIGLALKPQVTPALTAEQKAWLAKAERHEKAGWIYLHIKGEPRERGFQHGYLLARDIAEGIRIQRRVWEYQSAHLWSWLVGESTRLCKGKIDPENAAEIDGLVEGLEAAGVPLGRDELVAYNASAELLGYWWPSVKDGLAPMAPEKSKDSCSSFIATGKMTSDGGIVLAHNTWSEYYYAVSNVILDIRPARGHRILMQTSAGLIHSGTDFFVTDAGLVGAETTIGGFFPFDPQGTPEFVRMRRATQDASSIDEWCAIMKKGNNGGYANAWLLGDVRTNEIARLELGLKHVGFERTKDGWFAGSNVAENLRILRLETRTEETNIKNSDIARRVRWKKLLKENAGRIDRGRAQEFLSDHFDTYLGRDRPGMRTLCGHGELDDQAVGVDEPYYPLGAFDGKVVDSALAKEMSFLARWGSPCGRPFEAAAFLEAHPQYDWMAGLIKDRPTRPWMMFKAGEAGEL